MALSPSRGGAIDETAPRSESDDKYTGEEREARQGVALCLSGGGYRAVLFHLGALRRLNELGVLSKVDTISTVSGGSILSAFVMELLDPWPQKGEVVSNWDARVAAPVRAFTRRNIRTLWFLRRMLPWNLPDSTVAVRTLERRYRRSISKRSLSGIPPRPRFVFCATDMAFGANWEIERERMGDYQAGYAKPPPDWPLARALAASSCFPPAFDPLPIEIDPDKLKGGKARRREDRDELIRGLRLTDGGVYDNMAIEPVWKRYRTVLVSDGGATLDFHGDPHSIVKRVFRYQGLQAWQASAVRKRWLISRYHDRRPMGAYWGIGSTVDHYPERNYGEELVDGVISEVRTDLDYFTDAEAAVLENHGYALADAALRSHPAELEPFDPVAAPFRAPHEKYLDEGKVKATLHSSHKRRLPFGRWRLLSRA